MLRLSQSPVLGQIIGVVLIICPLGVGLLFFLFDNRLWWAPLVITTAYMVLLWHGSQYHGITLHHDKIYVYKLGRFIKISCKEFDRIELMSKYGLYQSGFNLVIRDGSKYAFIDSVLTWRQRVFTNYDDENADRLTKLVRKFFADNVSVDNAPNKKTASK